MPPGTARVACPFVACSPSALDSARRYVPKDPTSTALYGLVLSHRATFERVAADEGGVPGFVSKGFETFLRCGVLAHGFARFGCKTCSFEHLVPLSCKTRGLCPSCGGRRMAAITRHIMQSVLPHVPTRQWVLSLPYPLRYKLAYDHELCTAVHRALFGAIRCHTRRVARSRGAPDAQTGAITLVQRYGSGLNLNVHFHLIALDGWFARGTDGALSFDHAPSSPSTRSRHSCSTYRPGP